jgi:hypothetical protein
VFSLIAGTAAVGHVGSDAALAWLWPRELAVWLRDAEKTKGGVMKASSRRRRNWIAVGAALVVAAAGGIAYAAIPNSAEMINGCVQNANGRLRVVDDPGTCRPTEKLVSWSAAARATPSYAEFHYDGVAITAVGTSPIGMPTPESPATPVATLTVPQGVYAIDTLANAYSTGGNGIFSCWTRDAETGQWAGLGRTAIGAGAGYSRWVALNGHGLINVGEGGATLTLECWNYQASGGNPFVFFATMDALPVTSATITFNGSSPVQWP